MYVRLVSIFRHAYKHIEVNLINNFVNNSPPLDNWISSLNRDINNYLKYMHILMSSRNEHTLFRKLTTLRMTLY
jgi:hypothetical protein